MKVYQAISPTLCIADFIAPLQKNVTPAIPEGWYATNKEALDAFTETIAPAPKRGRPPKAK